jgi:predicted  nucleic acid-binding Zn-ribbon protein
VLLPGGVEQYLESRRSRTEPAAHAQPVKEVSAAEQRQAKKDLVRIEQRLDKLAVRIDRLHIEMAAVASDYARLADLQSDLNEATREQSALEEAWLEGAENLS